MFNNKGSFCRFTQRFCQEGNCLNCLLNDGKDFIEKLAAQPQTPGSLWLMTTINRTPAYVAEKRASKAELRELLPDTNNQEIVIYRN